MRYIVNPGDMQDVHVTDSYSEARHLYNKARESDPCAALYCSDGIVIKQAVDGGGFYEAYRPNIPIKVLEAAR